ALLRPGSRGIELVDLGSKNGLVSGGEHRDRLQLVPGGDAVQIGKAFLRLEEISTSDGELELALAPGSGIPGGPAASSSDSPSTVEVPMPARVSSPEAGLRLVRRIERAGLGAGGLGAGGLVGAGRRGRLLAEACRALGADALLI